MVVLGLTRLLPLAAQKLSYPLSKRSLYLCICKKAYCIFEYPQIMHASTDTQQNSSSSIKRSLAHSRSPRSRGSSRYGVKHPNIKLMITITGQVAKDAGYCRRKPHCGRRAAQVTPRIPDASKTLRSQVTRRSTSLQTCLASGSTLSVEGSTCILIEPSKRKWIQFDRKKTLHDIRDCCVL